MGSRWIAIGGDMAYEIFTYITEYMCFNQTGDISTLNGSSLKLVDKFTYIGSSVSSTETDTDAPLEKAWTAINMEVRPDR